MKTKQIEQHLKQAVTSATPDLAARLASADLTLVGGLNFAEEELTMKEAMRITGEPKKRFWQRRTVMGGLTGVFAVLVICFGVLFYQEQAIDSVIALDVNPSIELTTNRSDQVLEAKAMNGDAAALLADMDLRKVDIKVAVNALIGSMVQHGYLDEAKRSVLISVNNKDTQKAEVLKASLEQDVYQSLDSQNIQPVVLAQNLTVDAATQQAASTHHISCGKAAFIQKMLEQDSSMTMEQLAPMTINQLAQLAQDRNLSLQGIEQSHHNSTPVTATGGSVTHHNEDCATCTNGCDCDDCYKYNNKCPECETYCGHYGKNAQPSGSGQGNSSVSSTVNSTNAATPAATRYCSLCSGSCNCEDCYEKGGCDLYCDDCNTNCQNYCADDDTCTNANHHHSSYDDDDYDDHDSHDDEHDEDHDDDWHGNGYGGGHHDDD